MGKSRPVLNSHLPVQIQLETWTIRAVDDNNCSTTITKNTEKVWEEWLRINDNTSSAENIDDATIIDEVISECQVIPVIDEDDDDDIEEEQKKPPRAHEMRSATRKIRRGLQMRDFHDFDLIRRSEDR